MEKLLQIVFAFFKIGLFGFGGGYAIIPLIQAQVVEQCGWISQKTFTDIITISQMTPGPLTVNTSTFVGLQIAGIQGAVMATAGCVVPGIAISIFLYRFFQKNSQSDYIFEAFKGLKASSLGLIASAAATILSLALFRDEPHDSGQSVDLIAVLLFLASFAIMRKWKVNPILVMVVTGILGGVLYGAGC